MKVIKYPSRDDWEQIIARQAFDNSHLFELVESVLEDVKINGDKAVAAYAEKFDKAVLKHFAVASEEVDEAELLISEALKSAISLAANNIETFHRSQQIVPQKIETSPGVVCWQKAV